MFIFYWPGVLFSAHFRLSSNWFFFTQRYIFIFVLYSVGCIHCRRSLHCSRHSLKVNKFIFHHRLPQNGDTRERWIKSIEKHQQFIEGGYFYLCELHFDPTEIVRNGKRFRLKNGAFPKNFPYNLTTRYVNVLRCTWLHWKL